MAMTQVSADRAMQSPYYGIKGWLLVIYVLFVLGALSNLSNAVGLFTNSGGATMAFDSAFGRVMVLVQLALALPFLILTPMKHRLMPVVSIACVWATLAIAIAFFATSWSSVSMAMEQQMLASTGTPGGLSKETAGMIASVSLVVGPIVSFVFSVLVTWYLLASKRVNATFRHRLPDHVADSATGAAVPSGSAL